MSNNKVWMVTGAARGLGNEIVKAALAEGYKVVATVRKNKEQLLSDLNSENLHVVVMDVTDEGQVKVAVEQAVAYFGHIDVLVNNAGFGLLSAVEEGTDKEVRNMYDTNVFGLLNVLRAVLPYMREQRSGHVVNISSVGGLSGSAGWGLYNSTKFAVEGLTEALSKELAPLGIYATAVEPGQFRTNFHDGSSLKIAEHLIDDYSESSGSMRTHISESNYTQPGDPAKLAKAVLITVESRNPPLHLPLGKDCIKRYQDKTAAFEKDLKQWYEIAASTDFDDVKG
ncbi:oxidoreductase [Chryseobacterium sp. Mn2064]|uniref:oxidoreductase n=1 Tax=Chryseobacterium sp. Mn2064 TaxID=3395263 RepID=UPI003BE34D04